MRCCCNVIYITLKCISVVNQNKGFDKLIMEREIMSGIEVQEKGEVVQHIEVERIADGFGFGNPEGISHKNRADVSGEEINEAENFITSQEVVVPVDTDKDGQMLDDDGCSDGRAWKRIIVKINDVVHEKARSLFRPKTFGGSATNTTAGLIATGKVAGSTLRNAFTQSIGRLEDRRIGFGAHTDDHAHGPNCGCGAIDKAPQIVDNVITYESEIRGVMDMLGIEQKHTDRTFDEFKSFQPTMDAESYQGADVADEIIEEGKVVKELEGEHLEMYVLLNEVYGTTVDQEKIRELSKGKIQVFGLDVWRLRELSERAFDKPEDQAIAFAGMIAYSLGVSATLTAGDLPVYSIKAA